MDIYVKEPEQPAHACVIWMHGLGADSDNMMSLANQLRLTQPVRHVFLDAPVRPVTLNNHMPMRAWYDISGVTLNDREDRTGIAASEQQIHQVIEGQIADGFLARQIYLAGFSQGGAMALYTGLRRSDALGGIVALSAYLPLLSECEALKRKDLPIFMAVGEYDPIVIPVWTKAVYHWLVSHACDNVALHEYPMEHSVCAAEIRDLGQWFSQTIETAKLPPREVV